jgi:hypothetical protein
MFNVSSEVVGHSFSLFLYQILKVGADHFSGMFWVKGYEDAGLDGIRVILVDLEGDQTVPPEQGPLKCWPVANSWTFHFVIPMDNLGSDFKIFNHSTSRCCVLAWVGVEQLQVRTSLKLMVFCYSIFCTSFSQTFGKNMWKLSLNLGELFLTVALVANSAIFLVAVLRVLTFSSGWHKLNFGLYVF